MGLQRWVHAIFSSMAKPQKILSSVFPTGRDATIPTSPTLRSQEISSTNSSISIRRPRTKHSFVCSSPPYLSFLTTITTIIRIYVAIILRITYGISVDTLDDEYVRLNQEATLALSTTRLPGVFWIEYFPFLKLIPAWVPGAKFRQHCDLYRPTVLGMKNKPFDDVQGAMVRT